MSRVARVGVLAASIAGILVTWDAGAGQATLAQGQTIEGVLEATDSTDSAGYPYDVVRLETGEAGRVLVRMESTDFDPYIRIAIDSDRGPLLVAEGMAMSPGTSAIYIPLDRAPWSDEDILVYASSAGDGMEGAYVLSLAPAPAEDADIETIRIPGRIQGALSETDELEYRSFRDRYRFRGRAGRRVMIGMTADFDAYLYLRQLGEGETVEVTDDDDWGGTDAFIEMDLEDADYEIVASSYGQALGSYELEIWEAPALVPAIDLRLTEEQQAAMPLIMMTDEEMEGLVVDDTTVVNEPLGFRFLVPGPDFAISPEAAIALAGTMAPNAHAWVVQSMFETVGVTVMALKAMGPITRSPFAEMAEAMQDRLETLVIPDDWSAVGPATLDWETRSFEWSSFDPTPEGPDAPVRIDLRCEASGPDRNPGLVVCLAGYSTESGSMLEHLRSLEIGPPGRSP